MRLVLCLAFTVFLIGCKDVKSSSDKSSLNPPENVLKDISELTYLEIYHELFQDNNGGFDVHADMFGQGATSKLKIEGVNSSCGKALFLSSIVINDEISLAVKASFRFSGNPTNELIRAYKVKPAEKISIGHSKLCYNNEEYEIKREIISAGFTN